jgi:urate oxidase
MARLSNDWYGKGAVRFTKVVRNGSRHELHEYNIQIVLTGEFTVCYTHGDNKPVIATDTMKNTVYALANQHDFDSPEAFGKILTQHFIDRNAHVTSARAEIAATRWARLDDHGKPHEHAFQIAGSGVRTAMIMTKRNEPQLVQGGLNGLQVLKTTKSGFVDFQRDEYTTLPDVTDRIFATTVQAVWTFAPHATAYNQSYETAVHELLRVFGEHDSLAVQQTIYAMGEAILATDSTLVDVRLTMPNQHRIPFNLEPLGMKNTNSIFVTTSEPFGYIHGTITRE